MTVCGLSPSFQQGNTKPRKNLNPNLHFQTGVPANLDPRYKSASGFGPPGESPSWIWTPYITAYLFNCLSIQSLILDRRNLRKRPTSVNLLFRSIRGGISYKSMQMWILTPFWQKLKKRTRNSQTCGVIFLIRKKKAIQTWASVKVVNSTRRCFFFHFIV